MQSIRRALVGLPLHFPQCYIDFNKEIVTTLVRFFMDSQLNKNGERLFYYASSETAG